MTEITLPIFVVEGKDIMVLKSITDLRRHIEIVDIENNVYTTFDARGRSLKLDVEKGKIILVPCESTPMHAEQLETILSKYLRAIGDPEARDECNLGKLVRISLKHAV